ncbi:MAG TPA: hypothetical protein DER43_05005 [Clostridiales bacterium]|nr:hypothetical protein [Clostridiales bacterium]
MRDADHGADARLQRLIVQIGRAPLRDDVHDIAARRRDDCTGRKMRANVGRERPVGRFVRGMQAQKTPSADRTRRGADKIELTADAGILPAVNGLGADLPGQIGHQAAVDRDKPRLLRGTERIVEHVHRDHADVRERKIIQMPRRVEHDGRLDPIEIDRAAGHQAQLRLCEHLRVNPEPFASMQPVGDGVGNAADADLQRIAVPDERQDVRGNARIECIGRFIMIGIERMIRAAERRNLRDMDAMVLAAGALLKGVDLIDALFDLCIERTPGRAARAVIQIPVRIRLGHLEHQRIDTVDLARCAHGLVKLHGVFVQAAALLKLAVGAAEKQGVIRRARKADRVGQGAALRAVDDGHDRDAAQLRAVAHRVDQHGREATGAAGKDAVAGRDQRRRLLRRAEPARIDLTPIHRAHASRGATGKK